MAEIREKEYEFEDSVLSWFEELGWNTYGEGEKWGGKELSKEFEHSTRYPIYTGILENKIQELNPCLDKKDLEYCIQDIKSKLRSQEGILSVNKVWTSILSGTIFVDKIEDDGEKDQYVNLIDTENLDQNRFDALSQYSYSQAENTSRPDIVLLINGIPISIGELKMTGYTGNTVETAIEDIREYESTTPRLFYTSILNFAATPITMNYGAPCSSASYYFPWYPEDISENEQYGEYGYDTENSIKSLFKKERIIKILTDYVFYDDSESPDSKVVPRHQQFFAVEKIKERTRKSRSIGKPGRGLIWHTQGSGKSYAMFYAARYYSRTENALSIILVDRDKIKQQMHKELSSLSPWFDVIKVESASQLDRLLNKKKGKIALVTVQLFKEIGESIDLDSLDADIIQSFNNKKVQRAMQSVDHSKEEIPSDIELPDGVDTVEDIVHIDNLKEEIKSRDVFLFTDEAHRYMERGLGSVVDTVLEDAHHYGFTGTPIQDDKEDPRGRNTFENYGMEDFDSESPYIHRYPLSRGCEEEVIVEVNINSHAEKIEYDIKPSQLDDELRHKYSGLSDDEWKKWINRTATKTQVAQVDTRIESISDDIYEHFNSNVEDKGMKAMVVAPSRKAAAKYAKSLSSIMSEDEVDVIYTKRKGDEGILSEYGTTQGQRRDITDDFKEKENPKIIVVCDMLLTGFDAPCLKTMYLDRNIKEHNLMQAIARTNRPKDNKSMGQIIDYRGISKNDDVFDVYDEKEIETYITRDKQQFIDELESKMASMSSMYEKFKESISSDLRPNLVAEYMVRDEQKTDEFRHMFLECRNLRKAIQPDRRLREYNENLGKTLDEKFKFLRDVYKIISVKGGGDEPEPPEGFEEDLEEILNSGVDTTLNEDKQTAGDEMVIDGSECSNIRIVSKKSDLSDIIERRESLNPKFSELSEKVRSVMKEWHGQEIKSDEAYNQLDNIEHELENRPSPEDGEMWLKNVVNGVIQNKTELEDVDSKTIDSIVERFEQEWSECVHMNPERRKQKVSAMIGEELIKNSGRSDVLISSGLSDKLSGYMIKNAQIIWD